MTILKDHDVGFSIDNKYYSTITQIYQLSDNLVRLLPINVYIYLDKLSLVDKTGTTLNKMTTLNTLQTLTKICQ